MLVTIQIFTLYTSIIILLIWHKVLNNIMIVQWYDKLKKMKDFNSIRCYLMIFHKNSTICPIIQLNSEPGCVHGHTNDRLLTMLSITRTSSLNFHFLLWSNMKRIIKFVFIWISNCKLHNKMNHVILESENSFSYNSSLFEHISIFIHLLNVLVF